MGGRRDLGAEKPRKLALAVAVGDPTRAGAALLLVDGGDAAPADGKRVSARARPGSPEKRCEAAAEAYRAPQSGSRAALVARGDMVKSDNDCC